MEPPVAFDYTTKTIARLRVSPEGQEGLRAFLEKRKPNWVEQA
jgi:methylglutaconyl-CoA hydratase